MTSSSSALQEVSQSMLALTVCVSQYEVYNEQIYDLLAEDSGAVLGPRPALRLKEDSQGRIFVQGLAEVTNPELTSVQKLTCHAVQHLMCRPLKLEGITQACFAAFLLSAPCNRW